METIADDPGMELALDNVNFDLYRNSVVEVNFPEHAMNGEVRLQELGDVASTLN